MFSKLLFFFIFMHFERVSFSNQITNLPSNREITLRYLVCAIILAALAQGCVSTKPSSIAEGNCREAPVSFSQEISVILKNNCQNSGCHIANGYLPDFTDHSSIAKLIQTGIFTKRVITRQNMPPGKPLQKNDLDAIRCWINQGYPKN